MLVVWVELHCLLEAPPGSQIVLVHLSIVAAQVGERPCQAGVDARRLQKLGVGILALPLELPAKPPVDLTNKKTRSITESPMGDPEWKEGGRHLRRAVGRAMRERGLPPFADPMLLASCRK